MEWIVDPTAWLGLATLVMLEIVLGIDNLIFIAILAEKLPPHQRDRARIIGLSMALVLRLALLAIMSKLVRLTEPLFSVGEHAISGRDLIFLVGGGFLLYKATMELHERLEYGQETPGKPQNYAGFWPVIAQIVVLDAVFSIDSIITAIGMVEHVPIMMTAVVIAIMIMMIASKPLTSFVNQHPTVIVLCLGFLMMIGFSLIADGVGFHVPKGYLYAAIGFSVLIEGFNQFARVKRSRAFSKFSMRERTAEAVFRLLGGRPDAAEINHDAADMVSGASASDLAMFEPSEKEMIRGVLGLTEKSVRSVMTPRVSVFWVDLSDPIEVIIREISEAQYSRLIVARDGKIGEPLGIIQKKDLLDRLLTKSSAQQEAVFGTMEDIEQAIRPALYVPETMSVLEVLDSFKQKAAQIALVVDEFGTFEGVVTQTDVLEAIAGDLPEEYVVTAAPIIRLEDGSYQVEGRTDLQELEEQLGIELEERSEYHTAAGIALGAFRRVPSEGESIEIHGWQMTVTQMEGNRIAQLHFAPIDTDSQTS